MGLNTLDSSGEVNARDMALWSMLTAIGTRANGKMRKNMDLESTLMQMEE